MFVYRKLQKLITDGEIAYPFYMSQLMLQIIWMPSVNSFYQKHSEGAMYCMRLQFSSMHLYNYCKSQEPLLFCLMAISRSICISSLGFSFSF